MPRRPGRRAGRLDVTLDLWTPTAGRRESGIRTGRAATRVSAVSVAR